MSVKRSPSEEKESAGKECRSAEKESVGGNSNHPMSVKRSPSEEKESAGKECRSAEKESVGGNVNCLSQKIYVLTQLQQQRAIFPLIATTNS